VARLAHLVVDLLAGERALGAGGSPITTVPTGWMRESTMSGFSCVPRSPLVTSCDSSAGTEISTANARTTTMMSCFGVLIGL
jgi:hypothetical protein